MRLTRTTLLIVVLGVLVIAFVSLYVVYLRQGSQQGDLEDSLANTEARLAELISTREALESTLAQRQDDLKDELEALSDAEEKFPQPSESISIKYDEILFDIIELRDLELEVVSLTASEPTETEVEDVTYMVTTFEVMVRAAGSLPGTVAEFEDYIDATVVNILDFVNTIATDEPWAEPWATQPFPFTAAAIEAVRMTNIKYPDVAELAAAEKPGATISLVIYSYQGE